MKEGLLSSTLTHHFSLPLNLEPGSPQGDTCHVGSKRRDLIIQKNCEMVLICAGRNLCPNSKGRVGNCSVQVRGNVK